MYSIFVFRILEEQYICPGMPDTYYDTQFTSENWQVNGTQSQA